MQSIPPSTSNVKKNPAYTLWVCQVNANYHGGMSEAEAERQAGPQPPKWQVGPFFTDKRGDALALALFNQAVPA